jgi:hypothetical protein
MQPTKHQSWQDGSRVVVERDGELPKFCVRCGEPGVEQLTRKLSWSSPWLLLLVIVGLFAGGIILYLIVASLVAKKSRVTIWLCALHASARRRDVRVGWIGLGLVVLSFVAFFAYLPTGATLELLLLIGGAALGFFGYYHSRLVGASRINDLYIWLKGVAPSLRSTLPQFGS